ncbi:TolC family protein [Sedimenticola selenatireducens]|uniref:TolC family protein n=1 Tax=Sedimenticola selenatireducens TaxID=191960 RepID=UPI0004B73D2E|nr:TolC family protein [Sedimenticola selenatireducens]
MKRRIRSRLWPLALLLAPVLNAEEARLPEPLTLEYALALADEAHPALALQQARVDESLALQELSESEDGWNVGLTGSLRAVHPSHRALESSSNDSSLRLKMRKRLYDFGHSEATREASDAALAGSRWSYLEVRQQRRLEIMRDYFDVLLSDLEYNRDNEAMTMGYLHWDKARQRNEQGQLSDIEVLELESIFQQRRTEWQRSRNRQRASRLKLAISLNHPQQLSGTLVRPPLQLERELPEVATLTEEVLNNNPRLRALRRQVAAAQAGVRAAKTDHGPTIHGELEAAAYNRVTSTRDPLAAALVIEVPLFSSGYDAALAGQIARLHQRQALLASGELELRQAVLDLWLEIQVLQNRQKELAVLGAYRDLYIDRSRALYELEVKSDLGDAQAQISDYQLQQAQADYALAMAWANLDALRGQLIKPEAMIEEEKPQ